MKKLTFLFAIIASVFVVGCASYSTRDGVMTPVGMYTAASINASRPVIAEYTIILGLFTSGYEGFLESTEGKSIDIIDIDYFGFFRKVQAVERK